MTWPASAINATNLDAGADSAATARADLLDAIQKVNQLIAHVSSFMQTMLTRSDAAGVRGDIGLANHQLVTVDASGNVSVPGSLTAGGNVTAYSDERLKSEWAELPADFVQRLAEVKAGTFRHEWRQEGGRMVGVSAQSLDRLLPEAVEENPEGLLSVAYGQAALAACIALAREARALRLELQQLKGAT